MRASVMWIVAPRSIVSAAREARSWETPAVAVGWSRKNAAAHSTAPTANPSCEAGHSHDA